MEVTVRSMVNRRGEGVRGDGRRTAKFQSTLVATRSDIKTTSCPSMSPDLLYPYPSRLLPSSLSYVCVYEIDGTLDDCRLCGDYEVLWFNRGSCFLTRTLSLSHTPFLFFLPPSFLFFFLSLFLTSCPRQSCISSPSTLEHPISRRSLRRSERGKIARYILKTSSEW